MASKQKQPSSSAELLEQVKASKEGSWRVGLVEAAHASYWLRRSCDYVLVPTGSKRSWVDQWEYSFAFQREQSGPVSDPDLFDKVNQAILVLGEMGILLHVLVHVLMLMLLFITCSLHIHLIYMYMY